MRIRSGTAAWKLGTYLSIDGIWVGRTTGRVVGGDVERLTALTYALPV